MSACRCGALLQYTADAACLRCIAVAGAEEKVASLRAELARVTAERDHLSSENASLASQVDSMALRIESLAEELAKPEDVRLREVLDALDGRAVIFDGVGARVGHLLDEMDEWIGRAGEAERTVRAVRKLLEDNQRRREAKRKAERGEKP